MPQTSHSIDTSNFKYITVKGQYVLAIAVKTSSSGKIINFFDHEDDLISYVDVSKVGFDLPAIEVIFEFSDPELLPYLVEKAVFIVSIGKDIDSAIQSTFNIVTQNVKQQSAGKWSARIVGIYDAVPYLKTQKRQFFDQTSVDVTKDLLQKNLGKSVKELTAVKSRDQMCWWQPNQDDYHFLMDVWLHSYVQNSIYLTAIDFEGTPYITDLRKQAAKMPSITLSTGSTTDENVYGVLDNFDVISNSSVSNNFGGYVKSKPISNMDTGIKSTLKKKETVILSESDDFNRASDIETEAPYSLQTANVHENYNICPMNNRSLFLSMKSYVIEVTIPEKHIPAKLLEYVMFKDSQENGQAQEDYSGIYMVGKIAHQIGDKKFYTHLTLWREAPNKIASPSKAEKGKAVANKMDDFQNQIDSITDMTSDTYHNIMKKYDEMKQKIIDYQDQVAGSVSNSEVGQMYKKLDQKYRDLKNYINNLYATTMTIMDMIPGTQDLQDKISNITIRTPESEIKSSINKYLDLQKYVNETEAKLGNSINSTAAMREFRTIKTSYNRMSSDIRTLQELGIIGDLNEYRSTNGEG